MNSRLLSHYSTNAVPALRRLAFWNDIASEALGPMVVDTDDRGQFAARMTRLRLGGCEITSAWSSAAVVRSNGPASRAGSMDAVHLELQLIATSETRHCGRVAELASGDFVLLDPCRPYVAAFDRPIEALVLRLPRTALLERVSDLDPFFGRRISGREGAGALLSSFLLGAWSQIGREFDESWAETVGEVLLSLVDLVYPNDHAGEEPATAVDTRRKQAILLIDAKLCDPEFSAREIAAKLGLSARYVQMLFAPLGLTPSLYILNRRLDLAARRLTSASASRRISDVAFSVGFNDLSYFCRAFRRRYGVAPRDYLAGSPPRIPS